MDQRDRRPDELSNSEQMAPMTTATGTTVQHQAAPTRARSLLLLRISLGLLMLIWGVDKLVNVKHGLKVSEHFYLGAFNSALLLKAFGIMQMALGVLIVLGLARRVAYPLLLAVTGITLLGVWKSVIDPWGWYLKGANALFYPSLIIFAAGLVLWAFRDEDRLVAAAVGRASRG